MLRYIVLVSLLALIPLTGNAAPKEDVAKIVGCMKAHTCKNIVDRKTFSSPFEGEQIVFIAEGSHYTLYWPGEQPTTSKLRPYLSFWVTPSGAGPSKMITFSDEELDGTVNFGIEPYENKFFDDGTLADGPPKGPKHRTYWQAEYDKAIAAAIRTLF